MNGFAKRLVKSVMPASMLLQLQVKRAMRGAAEAEVQLLPQLSRGGAFVDVGANVGGWTGPAARVFSTVHAFEPFAELAQALRKVAPANVQVYEIALSDHAGRARFGVPVHQGQLLTTRASLESGANTGFAEQDREVNLDTLDSQGLQGIDVIKIDVEGHEEAALNGAWGTIASQRPTLIIEIEERHHPGRSEAIVERIVALGYTCTYVSGRRLERFHAGDMRQLQPSALVPVPGEKAAEYINNFIFSPVERTGEIDAMQDALARLPG